MIPKSFRSLPWLFSAPVDLCTFLGSAALALLLLGVGHYQGWGNAETPEWVWIAAVVMIDVAHVYATCFRVYFDTQEFYRRPWLYMVVPCLAFALGVAVYSEGAMFFWRTLAYLAVFHFVRQQYGWVALYRAKAGEHDVVGKTVDSVAIYLATIYPLVYWHCHPRKFAWFVPSDFASLPLIVASILAPLYWFALAVYVLRSIYLAVAQQFYHPGKDVVVLTTALCWYVGIITFNSDFAFTVTNVITHGVPYIVLVCWHAERGKIRDATQSPLPSTRGGSLRRWQWGICFLSAIWSLAFLEELLWDCGVWHERPWLFGRSWDIGDYETLIVPLLAVPQVTHYILDGFIWRRSSNPDIRHQYSPDLERV